MRCEVQAPNVSDRRRPRMRQLAGGLLTSLSGGGRSARSAIGQEPTSRPRYLKPSQKNPAKGSVQTCRLKFRALVLQPAQLDDLRGCKRHEFSGPAAAAAVGKNR